MPSLVPCPACQQSVSPSAFACPKCGHPLARQAKEEASGIGAAGWYWSIAISCTALAGFLLLAWVASFSNRNLLPEERSGGLIGVGLASLFSLVGWLPIWFGKKLK